MTPELWERLKPLFAEAVERPEEERDHFIEELTRRDRELGDALRRLFSTNGEFIGLDDRPSSTFTISLVLENRPLQPAS